MANYKTSGGRRHHDIFGHFRGNFEASDRMRTLFTVDKRVRALCFALLWSADDNAALPLLPLFTEPRSNWKEDTLAAKKWTATLRLIVLQNRKPLTLV
jgi:hypothetical protein